MTNTYIFVSVTTSSLLHLCAINILVLFMVLIIREELFLLGNKLINLHRTHLSVAYSAHVESLSVCLKIL